MRLSGPHSAFLCLVLSVALPPAAATAQTGLTDEVGRRQALGHYRAGQELMQSERFDRAVTEFRQATTLDPLFMMAFYELGQAHMALKQPASALQAYHGAREAVEHVNALSQREQLEVDRDRDDAIREMEQSLRTLPDQGYDSLRARLTQQVRMIEQAKSKKRQDDNRFQVPAELAMATGSAYFRLERLQEAEEQFREAVDKDDTLGAAHNNLAVVYMLTGRFEEAEKSVRDAEKTGFVVNPRFKDDLRAAKLRAR